MTTDRAEADLNRRISAQRRNPLGLPPIAPPPHPLAWAVQGWGGHALAFLAGLFIVVFLSSW